MKATILDQGWLKVGDKLPPQIFGPFEQHHLAAYAQASGDDNPLHLDPEVARRVGLPAPPVHGMLAMSCLAPAIAAWRGDLRLARLAAKFVQPLLAGDPLEISGRVVQVQGGGEPCAVMRLMAHGERRALVILAEASLVPSFASSRQ